MSFHDHLSHWQNSVTFCCRTYILVYLQFDSCRSVLLLKAVHIHSQVFHVPSLATENRITLTQESGISLTQAREISVLLTAEDIKKRWQEYTEELYKKDLQAPDNNDNVITDLEPDILECEVKWALESITTNKASGGDGIPVSGFQILKDDAVKVLHSICQQIWKTGLEKVSFHSNSKERQCYRMFKLPHNCTHLTR